MKAAINWAASQSWSTVTVGMYGKSYDAVTGLMGNDLKQSALKAVVAGEPVGLAKSSLQVGAAYRALDSGWDAARVITSLLYRSLENDEAAWVKTLPLSHWTMLTQWACRGGKLRSQGGAEEEPGAGDHPVSLGDAMPKSWPAPPCKAKRRLARI